MQDYQGNSNKDKEERKLKVVDKVTDGEIVVPKKSLGKKFRDTFIQTDMKTIRGFLINDVLIPKMRDMIWDAFVRSIGSMVYGTGMHNRQQPGTNHSIISYDKVGSPLSRLSPLSGGLASPRQLGPGMPADPARNEYLVSRKEQAELVLERMGDIIDSGYVAASVADLHQLLGLQYTYVDETWGWKSVNGAQIRQTPNGFIIELPPAIPLRA